MSECLRIDPEFRDLIPPLTTEERAGLEENIKADGCHTPIFVWDDIIIDGHNRYEICTRNEIPFEVSEWEFDTRQDARIWILRNQFDRRNLTPAQRMDLALLLKSDIQARAQERQKATLKQGDKSPVVENLPRREQGKTRDEVAKLAGVSGRTLDKYEKVKETASPELVQAVRENRVSVDAAAKAAKTLPPEKQLEVLKSVPGKVGKAIRKEVEKFEAKEKQTQEWNTYVDEMHDKLRPADFDPEKEAARVHITHTLYNALEGITNLPDVAEVLSMIPDYAEHKMEMLDPAIAWLTELQTQFKEKVNDRLEKSA